MKIGLFANDNYPKKGGYVMEVSSVKQLVNYSFLVVFANDDIIDAAELNMIERIALRDNEIDDEEREVLRSIFAHAARHELVPEVRREIAAFRERYKI